MSGHGAGSMEGEWLFKGSLVVLTTSLVSVSPADSQRLFANDRLQKGLRELSWIW